MTPVSQLPNYNHGALFYTPRRTPRCGGRPLTFCSIFGHGRPAMGSGWPTSGVAGRPSSRKGGGRPASCFSTLYSCPAVFPKYPSLRGIFWEGRLVCISLPFTPPFGPFKGMASFFSRVRTIDLKTSSSKAFISIAKKLKNSPSV